MGIKTKKTPDSVGQIRVLSQDKNLNYEIEMDVMRSGLNDNNWDYRNLDKFAKTFRGTPILCAYVGEQIGDGHNMKEKIDPLTGEASYSFLAPTAERIVGEIYDRPDAIRLEERDGETWIIAKGKLWRFYNPELVDKIARQGRMDVSAETNVTKAVRAADREIYEEWVGLGVTILGDGVAPAVPGAHIRAMKEIQGKFHELQLRAAALQTKPQTNNEKGVKNTVNAMSNKKLLKAVQARFPDYRVLNMNDDGTHVLLLSADGSPCAYKGNAEEHGVVIPDRITPITLSAQHQFDDDVALSVDIFSMLSEAVTETNEQCETMKARCEAAEGRVKELETQVEEMQKQETARRMKACEDAVKDAAEKAVCMGMDETIANEVMEDIKSGKYTSICNADGDWIGAEKAVEAVMAKIGTMAVNQAQNQKPVINYSFDPDFIKTNSAQGIVDSIDSLVQRTCN